MSKVAVLVELMVMKEQGYSIPTRALILAAMTNFDRYDYEGMTVTDAALDILRQAKCDN